MILKLEGMLTPKRFRHSLGVMDTAVRLAKRYGIDTEKAAIAGLLHDCAKNLPVPQQIEICEKINCKLDDIVRIETGLIHAFAGAYVAKTHFGIRDADILAAIYYHTTGAEDMSQLMKIIYVADMCEPGRKVPGVEKIREAAEKDLYTATLMSFDASIRHVLEKGRLLHPGTILSRNFLIKEATCPGIQNGVI